MLLSSNYIWALSITLYHFLYHNFIQNTETKCHFTHDRHAKKIIKVMREALMALTVGELHIYIYIYNIFHFPFAF